MAFRKNLKKMYRNWIDLYSELDHQIFSSWYPKCIQKEWKRRKRIKKEYSYGLNPVFLITFIIENMYICTLIEFMFAGYA